MMRTKKLLKVVPQHLEIMSLQRIVPVRIMMALMLQPLSQESIPVHHLADDGKKNMNLC